MGFACGPRRSGYTQSVEAASQCGGCEAEWGEPERGGDKGKPPAPNRTEVVERARSAPGFGHCVGHKRGRLVHRRRLEDGVTVVVAAAAALGVVAVGDRAPRAEPEEAPQRGRRAPLRQTGQRLRLVEQPLGDQGAVRDADGRSGRIRVEADGARLGEGRGGRAQRGDVGALGRNIRLHPGAWRDRQRRRGRRPRWRRRGGVDPVRMRGPESPIPVSGNDGSSFRVQI